MQRPASRGALLTISNLFSGLVLGLLAGDLAFRLIPGSNVNRVQLGHAAIAAMPALIGFLAGGVLWGVQMGRMAGSANLRRVAWAGALGFPPSPSPLWWVWAWLSPCWCPDLRPKP